MKVLGSVVFNAQTLEMVGLYDPEGLDAVLLEFQSWFVPKERPMLALATDYLYSTFVAWVFRRRSASCIPLPAIFKGQQGQVTFGIWSPLKTPQESSLAARQLK